MQRGAVSVVDLGEAGSRLPTLVFVSDRRSGASRKMESLVAWVKVTQKKRLRVVDVDADRSPELIDHLGVRKIPSLLVLERGQVVDRLEGRATGRQIDALIRPHLADDDSGEDA
jgi:thioredoxin-like negative regulator of GroEL